MKCVFLWTAPRSCSSAFERSVLTLTGVEHRSEPFNQAFYFGADRQSQRYGSLDVKPNLRYRDVAESITRAGDDQCQLVFVKDMAYFMKDQFHILEEYFKDAKHSFLIRDPSKVITSQYRASQNEEIRAQGWDYFDPSKTGFKELNELYNYVKRNLDPCPVVVDADDLLDSPQEMMQAYCRGVGIPYEDHMTTWDADVMPPAWNDGWAISWRKGALASNGFARPSRPSNAAAVPDVAYPDDVTRAIEASCDFYEELYQARIRRV